MQQSLTIRKSERYAARLIPSHALLILVGVITVTFLGACGRHVESLIDLKQAALKIGPAMPKTDVLNLLGNPDDEDQFGGQTVFEYKRSGPGDETLKILITSEDTVTTWIWTKGEETLVAERAWLEQRKEGH